MKLSTILTVCLLLVPTMACGHEPTQLAPAVEINLKVTLPEAEAIWKGLRKLPVEEVEQLMAKIRQQVAEQTMSKKEPDK